MDQNYQIRVSHRLQEREEVTMAELHNKLKDVTQPLVYTDRLLIAEILKTIALKMGNGLKMVVSAADKFTDLAYPEDKEYFK